MAVLTTFREGDFSRQRVRSFARMIAVVVVLAAFVPAQSKADSITNSFDPQNPFADYFFDYGEGGGYTFRLGFDQVFTSFELTISDFLVDSVTVGEDFGPGFQCVEMAYDDGPQCVIFTASSPYPTLDTDYGGGINVGIAYDIWGYPGPVDPVDIGE